MDFKEMLKQRTDEVQKIVYEWLPQEAGHQKTIMESMNYSVTVGGKRLRPMLMQETYRLFGGTGKEIEPFMAAMEMMHSASLVHDDLPAMDNDRYRRGKHTTWVEYGEDMAVLAGDALMVFCFETALKAAGMTEHADRVLKAASILAEKSGIYGMIGGQTVDVELTNKPIPREKLDFIYALKTGALLEASMLIGAVLAGASKEEEEKIIRIAQDVGLAFQIQDDILDVTGDEKELGKPVLSDEKNHKTTYVTIKGLEKAKEDVKALSERAIRTLQELPYENAFLENLILMLVNRRK
ncbi:MAG: polyprenyl synthetase family protein [Lachnospiraceae bacterium]|nr:polyprenyl synthetase family protein [Lachnospiraceae bacterium]